MGRMATVANPERCCWNLRMDGRFAFLQPLMTQSTLPRMARCLIMLTLAACSCIPLRAYSVLTHEEIVDMAWDGQLRPLLLKRFPNLTKDDLRKAHAYAYGGAVIQDLGYYPFGSKEFSDLAHYVRRAISWSR